MKALIVHGGWQGHQPKEVAAILAQVLTEEGFTVEVSDTLDAFKDKEKLVGLDLIVPVWTMGKITAEQLGPVCAAVQAGVGIAGCHGGMCDSFREATEWQFMTGGQWIAHPGNDGTPHRIFIRDHDHAITAGIADFDVSTEQYYLLVDPAVHVLAVTRFPVADGPHVPNGAFDMPQMSTKRYGQGRVFYNALGHQANIVEAEPCLSIMRRGFLWAAAGKKQAR